VKELVRPHRRGSLSVFDDRLSTSLPLKILHLPPPALQSRRLVLLISYRHPVGSGHWPTIYPSRLYGGLSFVAGARTSIEFAPLPVERLDGESRSDVWEPKELPGGFRWQESLGGLLALYGRPLSGSRRAGSYAPALYAGNRLASWLPDKVFVKSGPSSASGQSTLVDASWRGYMRISPGGLAGAAPAAIVRRRLQTCANPAGIPGTHG
jgi:hypothetical protein